MNPSYLRIKLSLPEALARLAEWVSEPEREPPRPVASASEALELALDEQGGWRAGRPLFVYPAGEWTVFECLGGAFSWLPGEEWRRLAGRGDLVFAGYNDSVPCAELVVVQEGVVVREFAEDLSDPDCARRDHGAAWIDAPTWVEVAGFVDEDPHLAFGAGLFWLL